MSIYSDEMMFSVDPQVNGMTCMTIEIQGSKHFTNPCNDHPLLPFDKDLYNQLNSKYRLLKKLANLTDHIHSADAK